MTIATTEQQLFLREQSKGESKSKSTVRNESGERSNSNAESFRGNQRKGLYDLHYSASPVLGDDIPTEEECRQILLSMQRAMDREAPVLTASCDKHNRRVAAVVAPRSERSLAKPGLRINIPDSRSRAVAVHGKENARAPTPSSLLSDCSSASSSSHIRTAALAIWKRGKAKNLAAVPPIPPPPPPPPRSSLPRSSPPSAVAMPAKAGRGGPEGWASSFNLKARMSKLSLKRIHGGGGGQHRHRWRRTSGVSDVSCVLCRAGRPETRGLCAACEEDYRAPEDIFVRGDEEESLYSNGNEDDDGAWLAPPPRLGDVSSARYTSPSMLSVASQPFSLDSPSRNINTTINNKTPPFVPSPAPPTPLSNLPTPLVESRLRGSRPPPGSSLALSTAADLYDDTWAEYYFDDDNFVGTPGDAASAADRLLERGLKLDEYEAVFASPAVLAPELAPEGSWI